MVAQSRIPPPIWTGRLGSTRVIALTTSAFLGLPVIASGGVTNIEDIRVLSQVAHNGIVGAITGRAIYEGTLDVAQAQALADQVSTMQ